MFHRILGTVLLAAGLLYAAVILWTAWRRRADLRAETGSLPLIAGLEVLIYIAASLGISDYLLNTLTFKQGNFAEDKQLPGTLVACGLVPGAIIAYSLLQADTPVDTGSLLACGTCVIAGSVTGARLVGRFDGKRIKSIMRAALVCTFVILIARMILSAGAAGTAMGLSFPKLHIAAVLCFLSGVVNMFGIPMKPTWTALFLVLGLSPIAVLTMVLVLGALSPLAGGISVLRGGLYHRKMVLCATLFGSLGSLLGTLFAVSLPAAVLNILLLMVMFIAIVTMFRSR